MTEDVLENTEGARFGSLCVWSVWLLGSYPPYWLKPERFPGTWPVLPVDQPSKCSSLLNSVLSHTLRLHSLSPILNKSCHPFQILIHIWRFFSLSLFGLLNMIMFCSFMFGSPRKQDHRWFYPKGGDTVQRNTGHEYWHQMSAFFQLSVCGNFL